MIKKIKIENIQSHKETELELSSGINAIVGSSNNGKSAILRAFYWLVYNRPLGVDNLLSHWAFDKKGNQILPMKVSIENEKGTITRFRTKDLNQYIINGEELNVVKTDVPEQVEKMLCLTDTNIQRQQDAPFLLSLTSGQVAQYFNKTVRLDIIDRVLSNAESRRRKLNQDIKTNSELLKETQKKHEKYEWLEQVEKLLIKYENISKKNAELKEQVETLENQIQEFEKYSEIKEKYNFIPETQKTFYKIVSLESTIETLNSKIKNLESDVELYDSCKNKTYDFSESKKIINKIREINTKDIQIQIDELQVQIEDYDANNCRIRVNKKKMIELKKELPDICPLCGGIMKNGKCLEEK